MSFIVEASAPSDGHQDTAPLLKKNKMYDAQVESVLESTKKKFQSEEYQPAARIVFTVFQRDGIALGTISKKYTLSLNEKANLHKVIKTITGVSPSARFDLETLVGLRCQILSDPWITSSGAERNGIGDVLPADDDDTTTEAPPAKLEVTNIQSRV